MVFSISSCIDRSAAEGTGNPEGKEVCHLDFCLILKHSIFLIHLEKAIRTGDNDDMKFKSVVLLMGLFSLGIAFNNFSQSKPSLQSLILNSRQSLSQKTESLAALHRGTLVLDFCENSANYSCLEKRFTARDGEASSQLPCIRLLQGGEICPEGRSLILDSGGAQRSCGANCPENYEYTEYSCHLKLQRPGENLFPMLVRDESLSVAIEELHQACLALIREATQ